MVGVFTSRGIEQDRSNLLPHDGATCRRSAGGQTDKSLAPLPTGLRGAAGQTVINANVIQGYAARSFRPTHVEYVLTDAGQNAA